MVDCPRCGRDAVQLHPIPPEARTKEARERTDGADGEAGEEACRWCLHELNEG